MAIKKGYMIMMPAIILTALANCSSQAGLLRFSPKVRGIAQVFWARVQGYNSPAKRDTKPYDSWIDRARSAVLMLEKFNSDTALKLLQQEIIVKFDEFLEQQTISINQLEKQQLAEYLSLELGAERVEFIYQPLCNRAFRRV